MIKNIKIRDFKGIGKLDVFDLGRVVKVVGKNGAGKTSFLDAISWALTGKNLAGASKFEVKPISGGEPKVSLESDDGKFAEATEAMRTGGIDSDLLPAINIWAFQNLIIGAQRKVLLDLSLVSFKDEGVGEIEKQIKAIQADIRAQKRILESAEVTEEELEDLKTQLDDVSRETSEKREIVEKITKTREEIMRLEREEATLQKEIAERMLDAQKNSPATQLKQEITSIEFKIGNLKHELSTLQQEKETYERLLDKLQDEMEEKSVALEKAIERYESAGERAEMPSVCPVCGAELTSEQQEDLYEEASMKLQEKKETLALEVERLQDAFTTSKARYKEYLSLINQKEEAIDSTINKIGEEEERLAKIKNQLKNEESEQVPDPAADLKEKVDAVRTQLRKAHEELKNLDPFGDIETEYVRLNSQEKRLMVEFAKLEQQKEAYDKGAVAIVELETKLKKLKKEKTAKLEKMKKTASDIEINLKDIFNGEFEFELFKILKNGDVRVACIIRHKGVELKNLNFAKQAQFGIMLAERLQEINDLDLPILVDHGESIQNVEDMVSGKQVFIGIVDPTVDSLEIRK